MGNSEEFNEFIKLTNEFIEGVLSNKYLINDEKTYEDIINNRFYPILDSVEPKKNRLKHIINMFLEKRCIGAGSVLFGLGNTETKTSLSNCYYIPIESDSIEGIFECEKMMAKTFSRRGGCGTSITILRPKNAPVNNASKTSTGAVSFMPRLSLLAHDIGQNGRRGAEIIDIDCRHPDLLDFIWCKSKPEEVFQKDYLTGYQPNISYANISVQITNNFMEAVKNDLDWELFFPDITFEKYDEEWDGDYDKWINKKYPVKIYQTLKAKDILKQMAEASWLTGDPGIIFKDNMQKYSSCSFDPTLVPVGVNPCLPNWAPVLTPTGYRRFKDVKNEIILNHNIHNCSDLIKTHNKADVYCIKLESGMCVYTTKDHKIKTKEGDKELQYLTGQDIICCDYSPINLKFNINNKDSITKQIIDIISVIESDVKLDCVNILNYDEKNKNITIIDYKSQYNLSKIQLTLASLGIYSQLTDNYNLVILDMFRFVKKFPINEFENEQINNFLKLDFEIDLNVENLKIYQKIDSIYKLPTQYPVYDIQVPGINYFVTSGAVVHNCGEQALQKFGNCLLSAIVLYKYVKNPYTQLAEFDMITFLNDVEHMVYFMDHLIDLNDHPLEDQNKTDQYSRRIGIEVTGLHDMWAMLNMDYGSDEACEFIDDVMFTKAVYEIKTSIKLAKEKGCAPCLKTKISRKTFIDQPYIQRILSKLLNTNKKETINNIMEHGLRNCAFNTIGPTGSISIIAGNCTSGIEPLFNISYLRKSRLFGDKQIKMVHLPLVNNVGEKILLMTDDEIKKKYHYICAHDIDFYTRIKVQSTLQKWIDNSISSTINLNNDIKINDIYKIYIEAYEKQLKGITVFRDGCKKGILSNNEDKKDISLDKLSTITSELITKHLDVVKDEIYQTHRAYRYVRMWKKNKVYITITVNPNGNPIEIFANVPYEAGIDKNGIYFQDQLMEKKTYWDTICRLISLSLRLNMPIPIIVKQLEKSSPNMGELSSIIGHILKKYIQYTPEEVKTIKETKTGGEICSSCGENTIIYQGGCSVCQNCGESKCG